MKKISKKVIIAVIAVVVLAIAAVTAIILIKKLRIVREYKFSAAESDIGGAVQIDRWSAEPYTLYPYGGTLYFYATKNKQDGLDEGLYKVKGDRAVRILSLSQSEKRGAESCVERPLCFIDGHLIYYSLFDSRENDAIRSFDLETGIQKDILKGERVSDLVYETEYYSPVKEDAANCSVVFQTRTYTESLGPYFTISGSDIAFHDKLEAPDPYAGDSFSFGDYEYRQDDVFMYQSDSETENRIGAFCPGRVFETANGEFLIVQRTGTSGFWSIAKDGTVKELFHVLQGEKIMNSVCFYGEYMYLSVRRYKVYNKLDVRRFKNDSEEGFWKINIRTGEREKISGTMYSSLIAYGEDGIIACSYSKDIAVLDYNGKTKAKILTGSGSDHFDEYCRNQFYKAE